MKSDEMEKREQNIEGSRRRIGWASDRGAALTEAQQRLLEEAAWQSWRRSEKLRPRTMTNAQRKVKHGLIKGWRGGLASLSLADLPLTWGESWFREKDLRKILDRDAILDLVRIVVRHFGREYADPILEAVEDAYRIGNEEIVIQRKVSSWRFRPGLRP